MSISTVTVTLERIDWDLLREQETMLAEIALNKRASPAKRDAADGLLSLLDHLHEQAEKYNPHYRSEADGQ